MKNKLAGVIAGFGSILTLFTLILWFYPIGTFVALIICGLLAGLLRRRVENGTISSLLSGIFSGILFLRIGLYLIISIVIIIVSSSDIMFERYKRFMNYLPNDFLY
jgi:hypothetical protein